jgi:hypothetical protein
VSSSTHDDKNKSTHLGKEQEFEYMLSEINHQRDLMDIGRKRLEQIVTFYLTILTALFGATIAAAVATSGTAFAWIFVAATLTATTVGHLTFLEGLGIIADIVYSHSLFYVRRQYFLDAFSQVRRYVEYRPNAEVRDVWSVHFSQSIKLFLRIIATFNCVLLGAFIYTAFSLVTTWAQNTGVMPRFEVAVPALVFSVLVFGVGVTYESLLISRRIKRVRENSYRILRDFPMTESEV